jgi:hypothetical protein
MALKLKCHKPHWSSAIRNCERRHVK